MKRDNDKKKAVINDDIESPEVRLILDSGEQRGIVGLDEAKAEAANAKLDLVLISPDADPPVCKIMDYGKHVFELKKQKAANRKKQKVIHVKEVKFRPGTEEGDYQVKLRNLIRFLNDGDRAKVTVRFRGRELAHQHIGMELIDRLKVDLEEHGTVDQDAKMEGRQLTMVLTPVKKKH
ncbi:MAG: translation initiation factor IF-3 [Gammaproteobacteria bacterium]|nr:translation initiation factor IF-3 [Gammaproteobacteria bacterium]MAY02729.1 translation initiation factor IF-3 [Gammaproteobacteria bacterium]